MLLPLKLPLDLMQTKWASILNPIISNPISNGSILSNITLQVGTNTISHKLGRQLQGWIPIRYHGAYTQLYDNQDTNATPALTLVLNSSAAIAVDILVF